MRRMLGPFLALSISTAALPWVACDQGDAQKAQAKPAATAATPGVTQYVAEVVRRMPHDDKAYTQGLVFRGDTLFESTGRYGESSVRVLDAATGAVVRKLDLPRSVFAEGLAASGGSLVLITWKELIAYYYDPATFEVQKTVSYTGDGWGLCSDGEQLFMTSGDDQLIRRDPTTFAVLGSTRITRAGQSLGAVNELECVGDHVWANIYGSLQIVQIDKRTGNVVGELDATALVPPTIDASSLDHALNGIAFNARTGTYYLTGKLWPQMLEVKFVTAPAAGR